MKEHGEYRVNTSGQVLLFWGRGPWNDETLKVGAIKTGKAIRRLDLSKPWAQLSILNGESLMPPSTFNQFIKHTKIRKELGMAGLAIVIQDSDVIATIKHQLSDAYEQCHVEHVFFDSVEQAILHLQDLKFTFDVTKTEKFINNT